jgi:hypothetical protein
MLRVIMLPYEARLVIAHTVLAKEIQMPSPSIVPKLGCALFTLRYTSRTDDSWFRARTKNHILVLVYTSPGGSSFTMGALTTYVSLHNPMEVVHRMGQNALSPGDVHWIDADKTIAELEQRRIANAIMREKRQWRRR